MIEPLLDLLPQLGALFLSAFFAATLLPGGSEAAVIAFILTYPDASFLACVFATMGNTLGGLTNWWLGRYCLHFQDRRWFPVSPTRLQYVHQRFVRYGQWSLLFSWLPLIGDALCLVAGVAKLSLIRAFLWVVVGKAARYAALVYGTNAFILS